MTRYHAEMASAETEILQIALDESGGSAPRAAEWLGIPLRTLYHRLSKHRIDPGNYRAKSCAKEQG